MVVSRARLLHADLGSTGLDFSPYGDFAGTAKALLTHLQGRLGFSLWMITRIEGDHQVVLQVLDDGYGVRPGDVFRWSETLCSRMLDGSGPHIAPNASLIPAFVSAGVTRRLPISAYAGVPLERPDGSLFGTLCAFDPAPQRVEVADQLPLLQFASRILSTVLVNEIRSEAEARRAERAEVETQIDALTSLANRRAWKQLLAAEEARCAEFGHPACVIAVDLDGLKKVNESSGLEAGDELLRKAALALRKTSRASDVVARLGGDEFGIIGVECDLADARRFVRRLERALLEQGISASIGLAARDPSRGLSGAWLEADEAMYLRKSSRSARRSRTVPVQRAASR